MHRDFSDARTTVFDEMRAAGFFSVPTTATATVTTDGLSDLADQIGTFQRYLHDNGVKSDLANEVIIQVLRRSLGEFTGTVKSFDALVKEVAKK